MLELEIVRAFSLLEMSGKLCTFHSLTNKLLSLYLIFSNSLTFLKGDSYILVSEDVSFDSLSLFDKRILGLCKTAVAD